MQTKQILSADVLDILFDGKNKEYGAYQLRKTYNKRVAWALTGTMLACLVFLVGTLLASGRKETKSIFHVKDVELSRIPDIPKPEPPKPLPQSQPQQPQIKTIRDVVPVITEDDKVRPEDQMKPIDEIENAAIGTFNRDGVLSDNTVMNPPVEKSIGGVGGNLKMNEDDDAGKFVSVQMEAEFPGGKEGWKRYLERNLNSSLPAENGAPVGKYSVIVSFMVDANGNISDVVAENDPGYGAKDEAIRIIKKGPKWKPASQNGRSVAYRVKQQVTFEVNMEQ